MFSIFKKKPEAMDPQVLMSAFDALLRANDLNLKGLTEKAAAKASAISQKSKDLYTEAEKISDDADKVYAQKLEEIDATHNAAIRISEEKMDAADELAGEAEKIENAIAAFEIKA